MTGSPVSSSPSPALLSRSPGGGLHAAARPLLQGAGWRPSAIFGCASASATGGAQFERPLSLSELSEGPYFVVASWLTDRDLCASDALCRLCRSMNRANAGPWRMLGSRMFRGIELDGDGGFEPEELCSRDSRGCAASMGRAKYPRFDWKSRYGRFRNEVLTFQMPFGGAEITHTGHPDEVAYCSCRLRADVLSSSSEGSCLYIEVEVISNADNLSLAVVDFEAGGRSSVTFSPDTGAVIRERKVRESPRTVEGAFVQPLQATPPGRRFEGSMGICLKNGQLAFFRRCVAHGGADEELQLEAWECTGFVTDLSWAEGRSLTPCIAFRDEGAYRVRIVKVGSEPPVPPAAMPSGPEESSWTTLDWEAAQPIPQEVTTAPADTSVQPR
eukprot:TRINITY_DN77397_c0_g1_i1.p1 TRINITY_DN77397_c0_g1~~TRINITY_DN77397_c0_g1_i1.p1  ORF type:complete len:404 (+),score=28.77 TRINITY_DN77397_c0_g1_i1:55-1212(+)